MFVFCWVEILTLIAGISASQSQVYMSHNRGYRGISVHIDAETGQENCAGTIEKIKDMFTAGSLVLQRATNFTASPVHFSQVTILTPSDWTDKDCQTRLGTVNGNTLYKHPDLLILPGGAGPRHTVQGATCGEPGHQISLPVSQLGGGNSGNLLVSEWSRLRWGVFPELGWSGDPLYPNYYYEGGKVLPTGSSNTLVSGSWRHHNSSGGCDPTQPGSLCHFSPEGPNTGLTCSLNSRPELQTVTEWCEAAGSSGPDQQSLLCPGRSVREVIASHGDFAGAGLLSASHVAPPPPVTFSIVRRPQPKYILIIETSARMTSVWQWVRKAIVNLLRYEIPEGCEVGIVTYSSGADVRHSLTRLTADSSTRLRLSDSVPDTANKLSSSRVGCVRCGVRTAMDQLLRSREAGAHLVIISASEGEDSLSSLDLDSLTEYVDYYNIRLSNLVLHMSGSLSSHYSQLASMSGGVSVVVAAAGDSVSLLAGLLTSLESVLSVDSPGKTYQTVAVTQSSSLAENKTTQGQFVIDSLLGRDSLFGVLVEDDENHHIKSVTFTDHQGAVFGPFTKMSSQLDDINLKTINFPVGLRPPFDEEARLGQVWKYHISWYEDPSRLDNVVVVRSRPREGGEKLDISGWTNEVDAGGGSRETPIVLYVKVSVAGLPVVGAEVGLRLLYIDNNGAHRLVNQELSLADDGSADPDLTRGDGVYSLHLSPHLVEAGTYRLGLTVSNRGNQTFIGSPLPSPAQQTCCGSLMRTRVDRLTGAFTRQLAGPLIHRHNTSSSSSNQPRRVMDLRVEYRETSHQVELTWSRQDSLAEVESFIVSYSDNIKTVILGSETRDTVITASEVQVRDGVLSQVLPGPEMAGIVYFSLRARSREGVLGPVSNIFYLNITASDNVNPPSQQELSEYNYTLLGAILGIITVFSLLTILAVSCWLQRRRQHRGKLGSLHGFSNKVSSGVNVVIDKSTSKLDSEPAIHHVATSSSSSSGATTSPLPPSSTSFANNITPTYWSASQLLADHEHRKRDNPNNYHHHHHGHHYHQYYPVHHESQFEDHDSDLLEDNNNEHNTSDHSSSTMVMLNTSLSSGTGSVRRKNITQV